MAALASEPQTVQRGARTTLATLRRHPAGLDDGWQDHTCAVAYFVINAPGPNPFDTHIYK